MDMFDFIQDLPLTEHQRAYILYTSLASGYFFSWTDKSVGFTDPEAAATFKRYFPDWKV